MNIWKKGLIFFVLTSILPLSLFAGTNQWTSLGPISFSAYCVAVSPQNQSTIYAGSDGCIFKSTDGGNSWIKKGANINSSVKQIIIDPTVTNTMYAITYDNFYKSTDSGNTFFLSNLGLPSYLYLGVIDNSNSSVIYLATYSGVYKTSDAAQSWTKAGVIDTNCDRADSIAIDPQNSSTLYVVNNYGVYKSTNQGTTWTKLTTPYTYASKIVVSPFSSSTLFAILNYKIYKSVDSGNSWTLSNNGLPNYYSIYDIEISKTTPDRILAIVDNKLYLSSDCGETWSEDKLSFSSYYYTLRLFSFQSSLIFFVSGNIYKSTDDGLNFLCLGNVFTGIPNMSFSHLNSNTIYLATEGGGIFKSTNKGLDFSPKNLGLTQLSLSAIAIDKSDENKIYVGSNNGAIFKSADGGESWTNIFTVQPSGPIKKIAVNPSNSQVLYACSDYVGMIKSSNGGNTWISINNGLPTSYISNFSMKPDSPDTILAATDKGLYKTSDGGSNWTLCYGENKNFSDVAFSPADSNLVFAYNWYDYKLLRSLNGGTTWEVINTNSWSSIYKIFPDPVDKNILYYVAYSYLYRSVDQGATFSPVTSPIYNGWSVYIDSLAFDPSNHNNLFVSSDYGIFQMEISCGTIGASPSSLPDGKEYQYYSQQISFSGGLSPYSVVLSSGALPSGLYLENYYPDYCYISGTPYLSGTYNFKLKITDSLGCYIEKNYTINITKCANIVLSPETLPNAVKGESYYQTISASGGTAPYIFYLASGNLPSGVNLSTNGILSGTPMFTGNFSFDVKVQDASYCYVVKSYTLRVEGGIVIDPASLPSGTVGTNYNQQLYASGGAPPYTFTLLSGSLPPDIILSSNGLLSGVFSKEGTYSFTVKASDSNGKWGEQTYTISVNKMLSCTISCSTSETKVGVPVTFTATISGGTGNYSILWDFGDGINGIDNPAIHIYNKLGTFDVIAIITDSSSASVTSNVLQIKVISDLTISANSNPRQGDAPLKVFFSSVATGGESPYSYRWDFGDGATSQEQNCEHTYTKEGNYVWTVTVTDSQGRLGIETGTIVVNKPLNPPTITSVQSLSLPFRLVINGFNFTPGCSVIINNVAAPSTAFKSSSKVVAKKGYQLKLLVPKGVAVEIKVRNIDGIESQPFHYTR